MAETEVQHESLLLPGYWRLANFGKLTENPLSGTPDLRIRACLAPLQDPEKIAPEEGQISGKTLKHMLLPVGELPRLHLNAILHNGRLVAHDIPSLDFENRIRRQLDCARSNIRVIGRLECDEQGELIVPKRGKWEHLHNDPELQGLFIAIGTRRDPFATIIPAVEVFRFFYATSDVLAKALLRDHFLDPDTHLWNAEKTAMTSDGRALLWLRKRMLDADARFLARFAFDDYALHQAQQIFLYASAVGRSHGDRIIRALPPFQEAVETKFLCLPIGGPDGERVLVTRLLRCDWKPPWTNMRWDRDNDGRYDPDRREERDPTDWKPGLLTVPNGTNLEPAKLANAAPSIANVPSRLKVAEIEDRFPELAKTPAEKMPQEGAKTRAEHKHWRPVMSEAYAGSVVDGRSSFNFVGRTIIEGLEHKPPPKKEHTDAVSAGIGQEDYLIVLQLLQKIDELSLADVEFIAALGTTAVVHGVEFNVFPKEMDGKEKAWLYIDPKKKSRRMALLARVAYEGRTRYVIELQQRRDREFSTLVLWQKAELRLPSGLLACLVMDCARSEGTTLRSADILRVKWTRLHHTTKGTDELSAKRFLQRILDARSKGDAD